MPPAPLPSNENDRLDELSSYDVLDTPSDEALDQLTRLASHICGTPIALISLVDEKRQWFKSRVGLDAAETPRELAFCAHTILGDDVLVVNNATHDCRFSENPLVVGDPYIRFYAGAPLKRKAGLALGSLCVIDRVPRDLTPFQIEALKALSAAVMSHLETRRALATLRAEADARARAQADHSEVAERFRLVAQSAADAIICAGKDGRITFANPAAEKMFGYSTGELIGQPLTVLMPAGLREAHRRGLARFCATGTPSVIGQTIELTGLRRDGAEFPIELALSASSGSEGPLFTAVLRDISARKNAEAKLQHEKQFIEVVLENVADAIAACDADGNLVFFNRAARELHGMSAEPLGADRWSAKYDLFMADGSTPMGKEDVPLYRAFRGELVRDVEMVVARPNCALRRLIASGQAITDGAGRRLGAVVGMHDITDRAAADEAIREAYSSLRRSEQQFAAFMDNSPVLAWVKDASGMLTYVNRRYASEYAPLGQELVGKRDNELFPPEIVAALRLEDQKVLAGEMFVGDHCMPSVDGSRREWQVTKFPLVDAHGCIAVAGLAMNVTEQRQAAEELREAKRFAESIADQSTCNIYVLDLDTRRLIFGNRALAEFLGYSVEQAVAMGDEFHRTVNHPDDIQLVRDQLAAFKDVADGQVVEFTSRCRHKSGEWRSVFNRQAVFRRHPDGRAWHILGTTQDITDFLRTQNDLKTARDAAEAATRSKSEFLANMSHEIRTPMTSILGYANLLQSPGQSEQDRVSHVQTIRRNGEHLLQILNDLLDLSKIEAGKMTVERIACAPIQIVGEVESLMRVRAIEKGIAFGVEYGGRLPREISSDPTRLRQILLNLVSNAIKFTEAGGVAIKVASHVVDGKPSLRFDVTDTGIGLTAEQKGRMFVPFVQADTSTTRRFGGSGLGLAICQRLARMLDGDLSVESEPGVGSTFSLTVPAAPVIPSEPTLLVDPRITVCARRPGRTRASPRPRPVGRGWRRQPPPDHLLSSGCGPRCGDSDQRTCGR